MKKNNLKIELNKGDGNGQANTISLEGELTLHNIETIWDRLREEVLKNNKLIIELRNVENMDLSCLQLLSSIQRFNSNVKVKMNLSDQLETLLLRGGFSALLN